MNHEKSQATAIILSLLYGVLGVDRFYLGYTWQGVVKCLTVGGLGIWWFVDLIRIIVDDLGPSDHSLYAR